MSQIQWPSMYGLLLHFCSVLLVFLFYSNCLANHTVSTVLLANISSMESIHSAIYLFFRVINRILYFRMFNNLDFFNNFSYSIRSSKFLPHNVVDEESILRVDMTTKQFSYDSLVFKLSSKYVCLGEFFRTLDYALS